VPVDILIIWGDAECWIYMEIGVGKDLRPPRPPNRACGSLAHGSPVGGLLIGISSRLHGLHAQ
jgi:hypothetical protein